ncbi:alanine--tRNA ligase [Candidatus Pacearchaeota archaeon]|nr:alanine--tRNA ligase [Candidatus Pacearchaeota archaeon]
MVKARKELIKAYLDFFKAKSHKVIPNAPLIPENDPTVLFTTAGMHPLVPYLLSQPHPQGKRLCSVQKCIRTQDIGEVGDTYHHTFFEMLGNWSLGDYWKKEAIEMSFEFLTKSLKIPKEKLAVSCFTGDKDAPKDEESAKIWLSLGVAKERIAFLPKENNWWGPAGETGPCGPDTEMFYWIGKEKAPQKFDPSDNRWLEFWNNVFMQYNKTKSSSFEPLKQKNVDTGMGVERTIAMLNGIKDAYLTECFLPIVKEIERLSGKRYSKNQGETRAMRIIADHIKAAVFILAECILPSNKEQGYILRRLIRRAIRYGKEIGIKNNFTNDAAGKVFDIYSDYEHLQKNKKQILEELEKEEGKFEKVLEEGLKKVEKIFSKKIPVRKEKFVRLMQLKDKSEIFKRIFHNKRLGKEYNIKEAGISDKEVDNATISGAEAFYLYQSFGFPIEMIIELVREKSLFIDIEDFEQKQSKHQKLSRTATEGRFKSGLADTAEQTTRLHTATHLLLAALRVVLKDESIMQKGSNITAERLRFDFSFPRKLAGKEIKEIEELVNAQAQKSCEVTREEMPPQEARKKGAIGVFDKRYGEKVSVYSIGSFSKEICAGPHVKNTCELGRFKIIKEEAVAAGIRRIKAVLE